jgi:hypothetical protein
LADSTTWSDELRLLESSAAEVIGFRIGAAAVAGFIVTPLDPEFSMPLGSPIHLNTAWVQGEYWVNCGCIPT